MTTQFKIIPMVEPNLAINANGARNRPVQWGAGAYYFSPVGPDGNMVWSIDSGSSFSMIVPTVNPKLALDANGGQNLSPDKGGGAAIYFNSIQANDNLLWAFQAVDSFFRIIPKVKPTVALDANGGRNRPETQGGGSALYFNSIAGNENNGNLLWTLQQVVPQPNPATSSPKPPAKPTTKPPRSKISVTFRNSTAFDEVWTIKDGYTGNVIFNAALAAFNDDGDLVKALREVEWVKK